MEDKFCSLMGKKKFTYRGCGLKSLGIRSWSKDTKEWIMKINGLFKQMFGGDFFTYTYSKDHGTSISEEMSSAILEYNHEHWEIQYAKSLINDEKRKADNTLGDECSNFGKPAVNVVIDAMANQAPKSASRLAKQCKDSDGSSSDEPVNGSFSPEYVDLKDQYDFSSQNDFDDSATLEEVVVIGTSTPDIADRNEECHSTLCDTMAKATTIAELAAVCSLLPPVSTSCTANTAVLHPEFGSLLDNPFTIDVRPCETVVDSAQTLFDKEKTNGKNPSGVNITGIGKFSEEGLNVLKQFCVIADTNRKVSSEANWLARLKCSPADVKQLQEALWHHSPSTTILRHGKKSIDVASFSDLAEERYIDSFVLDISIAKFLEEARENGKDDTLYFPTEVYEWMRSGSKEFKQAKLKKEISKLKNVLNLKQILLPVHMPNHWGLVCVDLAKMNMYFDDGLTSAVPPMTLPTIIELLDLFATMHPSHPNLQTHFWQTCYSFKRFGMPSQAPVGTSMVGMGSCGIGVILAAKDFLEMGSLCIRSFWWRFCNMDIHRKNLMLQILSWSD